MTATRDRWVERAGVALHVAVDGPAAGDRTPVVVVHGVVRDGGCWGWLADRLAGERLVVRPDARGHGLSDRAPGAYRLQEYVDDAAAVIDEVVGRPAVVVGHSLGGIVGATLAQQRPDLVAGLVLVDPALALGEPWPTPGVGPTGPIIDTLRWQRQHVPAAVAAGVTPDVHAEVVGARPSGHGDTVVAHYVDGVVLARAAAELRCDLTVADRVVDPPPDHLGPGWDPLGGLRVPGVVLAADRRSPRRVTGRVHAERFAATAPHVRWVEVAGADHDMQDEPGHRETVAAQLAAVLAITDAA